MKQARWFCGGFGTARIYIYPVLMIAGTGFLATPCVAQSPPLPKPAAAPWHPALYFGAVNFNDQLTPRDTWRQTAARIDGMLLHIHFFVRKMDTPGNRKVESADETIRRLAPNLAGKANIAELTFHIRDAATSPEEIGRTHARNIEDLEKAGIPVAGVNVDWILDILDVSLAQTPRNPDESEDSYSKRVLATITDKSARYVRAFRATGRDEKLYAVFPPIYVDEGHWINVRKVARPNLTVSRLLNCLFDVGFDGFTADSPYFVLVNPAYKAAGYYNALRSIEQTCRMRSKTFGFIVNGDNKEEGSAYDRQFAQTSIAAFDLMFGAGLRPDRIVLESWYKGPFRLAPETEPGTLTNTVLEIAKRLPPGVAPH